MRYSQYFIPTVKETPADAEVISHQLMLRAGMIRKLAAGIYNYLPMGLRSIRKVAQGGKVLPSTLTPSLLSQIAEHATLSGKGDPFKSVRMTNREREVVELIAEGLSNKQIADRLHLAVDTVKSHVHNILEKLALHTRLEIANYRHAGGTLLPSGRSPRHKGE